MEGRDGADIPLLGCSVRIHVPRCFTMEEKQRPPPHRRGEGRHVGPAVERLSALPGVWRLGDGEETAERLCWRLDSSADHNSVWVDARNEM